ncbi:MAG: hypothetical protein WAT70_11100 [Rhizobiaceae bacterium]
MRKQLDKAGAAIDRIGGRLLYTAFGVVATLAALAAAWMGWSALSDGQTVGGLLAVGFAAGMALLARYCFSPRRRLSDMEP